jgi:PEP-CTERM motif
MPTTPAFTALGALCAACALLVATPAQATELTFTNWTPAGQPSYADRVSVFSADYLATGGATPNVVLDFVPLNSASAFSLWNTGYGNLTGALGHGSFNVQSEIRFTADAGFETVLQRFDLAGWSTASYPNSRIWITNQAGNVLFDTGTFTWQPGITTRYSPEVRSIGTLTLHINDLGDLGLDNVVFSQVAVIPEPQTWALMAAGLLGLGSLVRRRADRR